MAICYPYKKVGFFILETMEMEKKSQFFRTKDMALITTLSMLFRIEATERDRSGVVYFLFAKSLELDVTVKQYWCAQITVEPQKFLAQLKIIKTCIHAEK